MVSVRVRVPLLVCAALIPAERFGQKARCESDGTLAQEEGHGGSTWMDESRIVTADVSR